MYEWKGGRIRKVRKAKGITGRELARRVGITQTTLSHYETGKTIPPYDVFFDIANALEEQDIRWLAGFSNQKERDFDHIANLLSGNEEFRRKQKNSLIRWERKAVSAIERTFERCGAGGNGMLYQDGQRFEYSIPGPKCLRVLIQFRITFQTDNEEIK